MKNNQTDAMADNFRIELENCLSRLKSLSADLDPYERIMFMNEVILKLLPERKQIQSAQEKLNSKKQAVIRQLSPDEERAIGQLSVATERLSNMNGTLGLG